MKVLIGIPGYQPGHVATVPLAWALNRKATFAYKEETGSLLTLNHNRLLCLAMNMRREGITHLLILHSDVEPRQEDWFEVLCRTMEESEADILSNVIPIKDATGITSTALDIGENKYKPYRLSLQDIAELPLTFTADHLLLNTGCIMIDVTRPWLERGVRNGTVKFTMHDDILTGDNDLFWARIASEDWEFSRLAVAAGAKLYATKAIQVHHYGISSYDSRAMWGGKDPMHPGLNKEIIFTAPGGEMKVLKV